MIRDTLAVADAEDFARSLRRVQALLVDIRRHSAAGRADSEAVATQLAAVLHGSTNAAAKAAVTASASATQMIEEALLLIDASAGHLAGYMAEVFGPASAAGGAGSTERAATPGAAPVVAAPTPAAGDRTPETRPLRDIDDGESLRGATKEEVVEAARRAGWTLRGRSRDGNGEVWGHPTKRGEQIIINDGYSWADDPVHRGPYVKISRNGDRYRYSLNRSEES
jgi:hypothetical protein